MSAQTASSLFARALMHDALQRATLETEVADFLEIPFGDPFEVEPARALAYFRAKGLKVTFSYRDLVGDAHDQAFTVAKMMQIDLLRTVRDSLGSALEKGTAFGEWKKTIMPELKKAGWWGEGLGSARRLDTIFRTNMQTAYAAEQWEQIESQAEVAPFLLYDAVDDERTRPLHKLWDNTVLPVTHRWWQTHYPPNGYNCRCSVLQLSRAELDAMGISVDSKAPNQGTYPFDGRQVPTGVDPGFDRNVGKSLENVLNNQLQQKIATLPDALRDQVQASIVGQRSIFDRRIRRGLLATPQALQRNAVAEAAALKAAPADTLAKWTGADGRIKPERLKLHDQIVEKVLAAGRRSRDPTATILGGGTAAGKSNVLASLPRRTGILLDADEIRKDLPEYQDGLKNKDRKAAAFTHEESSLITRRIGREAAERGFDITLDGTADGTIESLAAKVATFRAAGQRVEAHYVTSSVDEALARALARGEATGRFVPEAFIREIHRDVSRVFPLAVERGLFDKFSVWDTTGSTKASKKANLIASGEGTRLVIHDRAAWERFLAKGR